MKAIQIQCKGKYVISRERGDNIDPKKSVPASTNFEELVVHPFKLSRGNLQTNEITMPHENRLFKRIPCNLRELRF